MCFLVGTHDSDSSTHERNVTYPVITGQQNQVLSGTGLADGGDSGLNSGGPGVDIGEIMGLVHDAESDLRLGSILSSQLRPDGSELGVGRTTAAANNLTVPAGVVVEVKDAKGSARVQAVGHLLIVLGEEGGVKGATEVLVDKVLPANGKTESVELVVLDEVVHLGLTGGSRIDVTAGGSTVGVHAEIEASNVDTGVLISVLVLNILSSTRKCSYLDLALSRGSSRSDNSLASGDRSLGGSLGSGSLGRSCGLGRGGRRTRAGTGNALGVPVVLSSTVVSSDTVSGTGPSVTTTLAVGRASGCGRTSCGSNDESGVLHLGIEWK
jgi:hypothetical protein